MKQAADYILSLEDKLYESKQTSLDLLKRNAKLELEVEGLKQHIMTMRSTMAIYIPVKNDTIDKKLAEYINNYPDRNKLKIMFMRE